MKELSDAPPMSMMGAHALPLAESSHDDQRPLPISSPVVPAYQPSRDEMNLAEFPLTVLSTRSSQREKTLEFSDTIRGKNGETVTRRWIITGADKFGLPTASDDEVLLGLLKLTVQDEFRDRKVYFTRYELLRILQWTTEGRSYQRLQRALDRLSGVRIKASNAFFDNENKTHTTRNFGIIDAYEINDGRNTTPKPSFFIWSEVLFKSFQVGFIKKLDLEFYLSLRSAVTKRLYRYLDKHFWYRSKIQINLFTLAHEKIGVSRNYRHVSSLRQQLDPAIEELIKVGFLSGAEYFGKGQACEVAFYHGRTPRAAAIAPEQRVGVVAGDQELRGLVLELLVARGIREAQAKRLLDGYSEQTLNRIRLIVEHFDNLRASGSHLVSRSPVGFLYRAVERPDQFVLPGEQRVPQQGALFQGYNPQPAPRRTPPRPRNLTQTTSAHALEAQYLMDRKLALKKIRTHVEPSMLEKLKIDVEEALSKLRGQIAAHHFDEAVSHGVEEKLLKLYSYPSFEQWLRGERMELEEE